ncbi:MAG: FkbM family methyltransferase [Jatrophihabitantaceae bacterium]
MRDISRAATTSARRPQVATDSPSGRLNSVQGRHDVWATARWEDQLPALISRLGLAADGVVQVGAHVGQEVQALTRCGFRRLVMMEPNADHTTALRRQLLLHHLAAGLPEPAGGLPARELVPAAAGRERGQLVLHVTEYDQQASVLAPLSPMAVVRRDMIAVIPLREVQAGCNVLVVDAQGAELEVLAGADLTRLQLAVVEGSTWARYDGGATLETIGAYMRSQGWTQIATWAHVRPHVVDVAWLAPPRHLAAITA